MTWLLGWPVARDCKAGVANLIIVVVSESCNILVCCVWIDCSMKRSSDIVGSHSDVSAMTIMDKFGLSSPTRAATAVRYRPSTSSASPSHLHHLLRSHSNASTTAAAESPWPEKREDGDGRSCDSIATCVAGLVAVSETETQSATTTATTTTATTTARQQTTPYHHFHHPYHHSAAAESDDEDDDKLTERRRRRLRLNAATTTTTTATTTTADDDRRDETSVSADSRTVSTSTVNTPLLHQQRQQQGEDAGKPADVQSSVSATTQPSFSQVISLHVLVFLLSRPYN